MNILKHPEDTRLNCHEKALCASCSEGAKNPQYGLSGSGFGISKAFKRCLASGPLLTCKKSIFRLFGYRAEMVIQSLALKSWPGSLLMMSAYFFLVMFSQVSNASASTVLPGDWEGIFQCGDSEFRFTLGLREHEQGLSGDVHYQALNGQRLGMEASSQLVGSAEKFGHSFSIETTTNDISKRVWVKMLHDQQQDRLFGKVDFRGSEICSYAIAERKGTHRLSKELSKVARTPPQLPQARKPQKCDRSTKNWLAQLTAMDVSESSDAKAIALHLLQDENFKPHFSKNVFALNLSQLAEINAQLSFGCRDFFPKNPRFSEVKGMLQAYLTGGFGSAMNLWLDGQASAATNRWLADIKQQMQQGRAVSQDDIAWLRNHLTFFRLPALSSLKTFDAELMAYRTEQAQKNQSSEIDQLMKLEPTWATLLALSKINPDRSIDPAARRKIVDAVRAHIAQHWQMAINNYVAAQQDSLESARDIFVPMTQQPAIGSMLHYLPAGAVDSINQIFLQRRQKLATDLAAHESEHYEKAFSEPENYVASMKRWQQIERDLKQKYQDLLREPPFYPFNAQRQAYYKSLLAKGRAALATEIAAIDSPTELDAWFNQVFPWDLLDEESRTIRIYLRLDRLAEIAPFHGADNEDYFNAIFRGDLAQIAQFERNYLQSNSGINLLRGVVAVYLLEYEKRSTRACLQSDAIAFDVTTATPETEIRNGYGVVISRTAQQTTYERIRVNKEFADIFPGINSAAVKPGGGQRGYIGGQKEALHHSMRRIMDNYPCDSRQIKTLEKNFIRLYDQHY